MSFLLKAIAWNLQKVSTSYLTSVLEFGSTFGENLFMMTLCDDFYKDRTFQKNKRSTRLTYYVKSTPRWPWGEGKGWKVGTVMGRSYMNSLIEFNSKLWYSSGIMYVKEGVVWGSGEGRLEGTLINRM